MDKKIILIAGVTGQDGSYLAEKLLEQGHEVHGIIRRSSSFNTERIDHIFSKLHLHYGDVTDSLNIDDIISKVKPDRIYNLAAQSHVQISFFLPLPSSIYFCAIVLIILASSCFDKCLTNISDNSFCLSSDTLESVYHINSFK